MRRGGRERRVSPRAPRQLLVTGASSAFPFPTAAGALRNTRGSISQLIPDVPPLGNQEIKF